VFVGEASSVKRVDSQANIVLGILFGARNGLGIHVLVVLGGRVFVVFLRIVRNLVKVEQARSDWFEFLVAHVVVHITGQDVWLQEVLEYVISEFNVSLLVEDVD
jgi:hypothetical protein